MTAGRLLAHYEKIADAPDAIPRLRRFILDLAVRGKLVEQDPNDEPASELLARIRTAKTEQKRKTSDTRIKTAPDANDENLPFELPNGWCAQSFENLFLFIDYRGQTPPKTDSGTALITAKNVRMGRLDREPQEYVSEATFHAWMTRGFPRIGDLLFTTEAPLGNVCLNDVDEPFALAQRVICMQPYADIDTRFLMYGLMSDSMLLLIYEHATGLTAKGIKAAKLKPLPIPIPPLAEQHRIVAKVDELMALCDRLETARTERETTRDRLAAASLARLNEPDPDPAVFQNQAAFTLDNLIPLTTRPDQIKALRQTILNLAVRGKLVEQDPNDEPAAELIKRIAEQKDVKRRGKRQHSNRLPEVSRLAEDDVFPPGWQWTRLDDVAFSMRYGTSKKCEYSSQGTPVLRIPNVSGGRITLDDIKFGPLSAAEISDLSLREGDLILIRSNGSLDIVGRAAVVIGDAEGMSFAGYLVRLRTDTEIIDPSYIWLAMNSTEIRDQIESPIRSTVGLKNINLKEFGALTFRLPPLNEQHQIVSKVDELMTLCDRLEASLATGDDTRRRLLDALLHEAPEETLEPVKGHPQYVM